jgi:hypothetical protein
MKIRRRDPPVMPAGWASFLHEVPDNSFRWASFALVGVREIFMPRIDIDGVGRIAFPFLPLQAHRLATRRRSP